jgi:hypothetical protein
MFEFIDRFKKTLEFEGPLTELFGTQRWKDGLDLTGPAKREFFFGLYKEQLLKAGAKYVLRFDLYRAGHLVYAIFFTSGHPKGADVMKRAIWKIAPFGTFAFKSAQHEQLTIGADIVDFGPMRTALMEHFRGKGFVSIEVIERFVATHTDFHIGQLRKGALIPLEADKAIEVSRTGVRKGKTYPPGTTVRFF